MTHRELWVLFQYSPVFGAPTVPVAVLGVEEQPDSIAAHVEWLSDQPEGIWSDRLAKAQPDDLPMLLSIWQHDSNAMATPVEEAPSGPELSTAVRAHRAELLAA